MANPYRHRNRRRAPSWSAAADALELPPAGTPVRTDEDLHICPECLSDMVQPQEWAPVDGRRWRVGLRCPECRWTEVGVFPQHVLDRFDAILDRGAAAIMRDLEVLERASMERQVDGFISALASDSVLPEDF